jgi:DNA-binding transcriptional regulator YhcF (GntR family)
VTEMMKVLYFKIQPHSTVTPTKQTIAHVVDMILDGRLRRGTSLPDEKAYAKLLHTAISTIVRAYARLWQLRYISDDKRVL